MNVSLFTLFAKFEFSNYLNGALDLMLQNDIDRSPNIFRYFLLTSPPRLK